MGNYDEERERELLNEVEYSAISDGTGLFILTRQYDLPWQTGPTGLGLWSSCLRTIQKMDWKVRGQDEEYDVEYGIIFAKTKAWIPGLGIEMTIKVGRDGLVSAQSMYKRGLGILDDSILYTDSLSEFHMIMEKMIGSAY